MCLFIVKNDTWVIQFEGGERVQVWLVFLLVTIRIGFAFFLIQRPLGDACARQTFPLLPPPLFPRLFPRFPDLQQIPVVW